ncbi:UTP--glucose-1-phosphate uridylyltransferase GalU [Enterococcus faecalis]|nr:UTP--glucose-1-phosphate uridylyltransferase GalU [Enterococcus faecalis]
MKIRKAIIPAAGLGTRFLPATKAVAKEMLPIVDKPAIQFIVEEALASGIEEILIITGKGKQSIEDHFDINVELENNLKSKNKSELLSLVKETNDIKVHFIRQCEPKGLGHAVLQGKAFIGDEPFVVMLGDDLTKDKVPLTKQLIDGYEKTYYSVIAVMEVAKQHTDKYGIIEPGSHISDCLMNVSSFVEKPRPEEAPSNLAIIGRYLLTPEIFPILETLEHGVGGEIQLTDAIQELNEFQDVYAHQFLGERYDIGDKFEFVRTTIEYALYHEEIKEKLFSYLKELNLEKYIS